MRILLIKPKWFVDGDAYKYKDLHRTPPLNLGIIAALSEGHEVRIIDEDVEEIDYSPDWDLVAISTMTFTSLAAYKISERFRKLGVKTVLGGVHPSIMPEDGLQHADAVVIGEAEPMWQDLLKDYEVGRLKKIYGGDQVADMNKVPFPRRDLMPESKYFTQPLQVTRGCVNRCRYCYLQSVPWKKYRKRDIELVYEEMKQIKGRSLFIVDDNLFVDFNYAKRLFDRIADLKKCWALQAPVTIAKDEELLEKMSNAGCYAAAFGFQSVSQNSLQEGQVYQNKVKEYRKIVKKMLEYKIMVVGFFMFGFDSDDKTIFKSTLKMIKELDLDEAILYILTPYPGTEFFKQFEEEGRILNYDWSKYSWYNCNFKPARMSPKELEEGLRWLYQELNKFYKKSLPRRIWRYKKHIFKYVPLTVKIIHNYFNWVDVSKLP